MKKTAQVTLLFALILVTPKAFSSVRVNTCKTCYIDYENGNDSWSGAAQTFQGGAVGPWKHAPGMQGLTPSGSATGDGCSGNCASQVPVAGDKYILKGGVVWPYTTAPWSWPWSGTSSTQKYGCAGPGCIYIGNAVGAGLAAWNKGIVNSIVLTRDLGRWNPASPPTISCSGGGGSGAAATPLVMPAAQGDVLIAGFIYHVTLTAQGSGYTSAPICTIAGGGGSAVLAADIDRAVVDLGALQSSPPDWPVGLYLTYPNTYSPSPGISSYDIFSGVEVRNILQKQRQSTGTAQTAMIGEGAHSTISNAYVHGRFVDCVAEGSCSTSMEFQDAAISPSDTYAEVANSIMENGDAFFLGTSTSQAHGICDNGAPCTFGTMGIATGTQTFHGPVSVHGNKIYSDSWQIRLAGNNASGNDPFLVYGNEVWLTLYQVNASAHVNRRYSELQPPATLISYNNIDHNHMEGSGNQQECRVGVTLYFFNEVIWGTGTSTPPYGIDPADAGGGGCTAYFYNDTLYNPTGPYNCLNSGNATVATRVVMQNIHCISGPTVVDPFAGSASDVIFENQAGSSNPAAVQAASTVQGVSTANAQGYTSSNLYAPTSANDGTVTFASGTGSVNLSSLCSGNLAALCADINGNTRPASGGARWQAGAYVYGSGGSSPVAAPTGLTAVVE